VTTRTHFTFAAPSTFSASKKPVDRAQLYVAKRSESTDELRAAPCCERGASE